MGWDERGQDWIGNVRTELSWTGQLETVNCRTGLYRMRRDKIGQNWTGQVAQEKDGTTQD